jgi:hypothetical protein
MLLFESSPDGLGSERMMKKRSHHHSLCVREYLIVFRPHFQDEPNFIRFRDSISPPQSRRIKRSFLQR